MTRSSNREFFFKIRFYDECLSQKHHYSFFLPTATAFAVVQFSNPSTKFFLLHFHFLCLIWCRQSGISTTFVAITPIIQFPSTIGNYREKKIKSFARKKIKKIILQIFFFTPIQQKN